MTTEENNLMNKLGEVWGDFLKFKVLHPDDNNDFRKGIHDLQRIVASRDYLRNNQKENNTKPKPKPRAFYYDGSIGSKNEIEVNLRGTASVFEKYPGVLLIMRSDDDILIMASGQTLLIYLRGVLEIVDGDLTTKEYEYEDLH